MFYRYGGGLALLQSPDSWPTYRVYEGDDVKYQGTFQISKYECIGRYRYLG